jgi:leader peptidase (prepilin peptidase)/N-methyltransferase
VAVPSWIWFIFIFSFGSCVGSFLNVVIYRLPRDKSLMTPPSTCPACSRRIQFYDNIPLLSWLLLGAKCRHCKAPISARYFVIELLTALLFIGLFLLYFYTNLWPDMPLFLQGGWFVFLLHITMFSALIAASAIDMELWVIPISICWFVTGVGIVGSSAAGYVLGGARIGQISILPTTTADIFLQPVSVASLAAGCVIGLAISMVLLLTGLVKRSYESEGDEETCEQEQERAEPQFDHRAEICKEIMFLLPILVCATAVYLISRKIPAIQSVDFSQHPVIAGLLGSLWGYFVGCTVVWATRILGCCSTKRRWALVTCT